MPQGWSLHIGLNNVDPAKYQNWDGALAGCVNDANAMRAIAEAQGFATTQLLNSDATADNILSQIGRAAHTLRTGDTFFLSYAGHGGQVPDTNGDEDDGLDETWVAYDRMIIDDELYGLWSQFAAGVRIEVFSDSCHSGSVIRSILLPDGAFPPAARAHVVNGSHGAHRSALESFNTVHRATPSTASRSAEVSLSTSAIRAIPPALALQLYAGNRSLYEARQFTNKRSAIQARVILVSGCQDNQTSDDGGTNGLFTEKLLSVWRSGSFGGTLSQFYKAIVALMPSYQTPNYSALGAEDPAFDAARPMTIVTSMVSGTPATNGSSGEPVPPSARGPATFERSETDGPTFEVSLGSNPYYIFEITSDTENFRDPANRSHGNFYASWGDPNELPRLTSRSYSLPRSAWEALRSNNTLYYRVGSTSSQSKWDNYLVSTPDEAAACSAPSLCIVETDRSARSVLSRTLLRSTSCFGPRPL